MLALKSKNGVVNLTYKALAKVLIVIYSIASDGKKLAATKNKNDTTKSKITLIGSQLQGYFFGSTPP